MTDFVKPLSVALAMVFAAGCGEGGGSVPVHVPSTTGQRPDNDPCLKNFPELARAPVLPEGSEGNYPCDTPFMRFGSGSLKDVSYGLCRDTEGNVTSRIETTPAHAAECLYDVNLGTDGVILVDPQTGSVALSQNLQSNGRYYTSVIFSLVGIPEEGDLTPGLWCASVLLEQAAQIRNQYGDTIPGLDDLQGYVQCRLDGRGPQESPVLVLKPL